MSAGSEPITAGRGPAHAGPADRPTPGPLTPDPGAAPIGRRVLAQARFDATVLLRNGEQLLLTMVLPALLMIGLSRTGVLAGALAHPGRSRVDVVAPGVLALAVMSTAFTGQAIGTGFDRRYGVLRLLGTTPLGRGGLLAGRVLAVLAVEVVQGVLLGAVGVVLGWRPELGPVALLWAGAAALAGTAAFVCLGLLLAGTLRAEAVLAGANLVWVLLLAGGGVVVPTARLGGLAGAARLLPSGALGDALRAALLAGRADAGALAVLLGWTLLAGAAALRWFRWE